MVYPNSLSKPHWYCKQPLNSNIISIRAIIMFIHLKDSLPLMLPFQLYYGQCYLHKASHEHEILSYNTLLFKCNWFWVFLFSVDSDLAHAFSFLFFFGHTKKWIKRSYFERMMSNTVKSEFFFTFVYSSTSLNHNYSVNSGQPRKKWMSDSMVQQQCNCIFYLS